MTHDHDREVETLISQAGARRAPSAERAARVRAAVEEAWRADVRGRRRARWYWVGGAVAAAALVGFVVSIPFGRSPVDRSARSIPVKIGAITAVDGRVLVLGSAEGATAARAGLAAVRDAVIETAASATAAVTLDDGGELRLGADTRVRLADSRTFQLDRGTVYLDSHHATPGSFTIVTTAGTVRDIGTRFEVRVTGGDARIRVREGAVQLERSGAIDRVPTGAELAVVQGRVERRAIAPFDPEWRWVTQAGPVFAVEGATLDAFLTWVEREGGYTIDAAAVPASLRSAVLHGSVAEMGVEDAFVNVLPTFGLTADIAGGRVTIRSVR